MKKITSFLAKLHPSASSIIQSGNGSVNIQNSTVDIQIGSTIYHDVHCVSSDILIDDKKYKAPKNVVIQNNEIYIDGFHQGDVNPETYLNYGLLK